LVDGVDIERLGVEVAANPLQVFTMFRVLGVSRASRKFS
jgi:hypothetical protein